MNECDVEEHYLHHSPALAAAQALGAERCSAGSAYCKYMMDVDSACGNLHCMESIQLSSFGKHFGFMMSTFANVSTILFHIQLAVYSGYYF